MKSKKSMCFAMVTAGVLATAVQVKAWVDLPGEWKDNIYTYVDVEKFALGEGFLVEPNVVPVPLEEEGELTVIDLLKRALGEENIQTSESEGNIEITAIRDESEEDGWLSAGEYGEKSCWTIWANGWYDAETAMDAQQVFDGDILCVRYSKTGNGDDVGQGETREDYARTIACQNIAEFNSAIDREFYLLIPEVQEAYNDLMGKMKDISIAGEVVSEADKNFEAVVNNAYDQVEEMKQALANAKETAKAELDSYKNPADYKEEQQQELAEAIARGKEAIDQAKTVEEVNQAKEETMAIMDAIKTAEELDTIKGDMNGDGTVSVLDLKKLMMAITKGEEVPSNVGDLNGDGKVSLADCKSLQMQLISQGEF